VGGEREGDDAILQAVEVQPDPGAWVLIVVAQFTLGDRISL
jgi:hypothetical protein